MLTDPPPRVAFESAREHSPPLSIVGGQIVGGSVVGGPVVGGSVQHALRVEGLTKVYKQATAVDGISFVVPRGSITALLGGNGAGKTTTLGMLLGLILPTAGSIWALDHDLGKDRHRVLHRMNFQSPYVSLPLRLTVRENLSVFGRLYGVPGLKRRIEELAAELELGDFLDRESGKISAGQKTRVALAKALINEPELLLLDEPTASLDPDTGDWIRTKLDQYRKTRGATLLLASHNMPEVERLCDQVIMLKAGRIVDQASPAQLIEKYGRTTLEDVFLDVARGRGVAQKLAEPA